jgi:ribosomal protein S18 acetylase RimI-like enzyme
MAPTDAKTNLVGGLERLQTEVLGKLDGLSEYELRRPMTPTGTNLLGVVKHLASVQAGYFGDVFGRPFGRELPWFDETAEVNADMWATPHESSQSVVDLYRDSWEHAKRTFAELDLDAVGEVPWWPEDRRVVSLHQILVHMTTETARHAGHLDIVRETIDGRAGRYVGDPSLPSDVDWDAYRAKLDAAARAAIGLRQARPEDAPAVTEIWISAWRDGHLGNVPDYLIEIRTEESFYTRAAQRIEDTIVAEVAGEIAGFVMTSGDELEQIYVAAKYRGAGIANALIAESERLIRAAGYDRAWLAVVAGNERARRFYERSGWIDEGAFDYMAKSDRGPIPVPCHRYVKDLGEGSTRSRR